MCLEVPEPGDDLKAVVDGFAAAAALRWCLPVLGPGDDVFDAGSDPAVHPVVVISDDAAGVVAGWVGDSGDGAVSAVAGDDTTGAGVSWVWRALMTARGPQAAACGVGRALAAAVARSATPRCEIGQPLAR